MLLNGSKPNVATKKCLSSKGYKLTYWDDTKTSLGRAHQVATVPKWPKMVRAMFTV